MMAVREEKGPMTALGSVSRIEHIDIKAAKVQAPAHGRNINGI
jgi:hypothetical protein